MLPPQEFFAYWGTTVAKETAGTVQAPNNHAYTSFLLATIHDRAFYEGLAAVLPCFVVSCGGCGSLNRWLGFAG